MSLVNTLVQNFRTKYDGSFDKNERRLSQHYGLINYFNSDTNEPDGIITDELKEKAAFSMGSTLQIPVIDNKTVTLLASRPLTVSDDPLTSQLQTVTFTTIGFGFTMYPAEHFNNEVKYQQAFDTQFKTYLIALLDSIETSMYTTINAGRTQVYNSAIYPAAQFVNNTLEVTQAQSQQILTNLPPIISVDHDYKVDNIKVVGSSGLQSDVLQLKQNAEFNAVNLAMQLDGIGDFWFSRRVTNANTGAGAANLYTAFAAPSGNVGTLTRNAPDNLARSRTKSGSEWDIVNMPVLNWPFDSYFVDGPVDASLLHAGTAALTQTYRQTFIFTVDFALLTAYNSAPATQVGPLLKYTVAQ
jgi:hypothetical protein